MRPVNPYAPNQPHMHRAFREGVDAAYEANNPQPATIENAGNMCSRPSAKQMIEGRISQLQAEIDGLRSIAKFATAMEDTPADEYLWKLIVGQRTV